MHDNPAEDIKPRYPASYGNWTDDRTGGNSARLKENFTWKPTGVQNQAR